MGKMLLAAAARWDVHPAVLDPDPECPCSKWTSLFKVGDLNEADAVRSFGAGCATVTIEIEGVSTEALADLERQGIKVYPRPETIRLIQDKGLQKQFFSQHQLPTSDYVLYDGIEVLREDVAQGRRKLPLVWKSRKGGYDGRGVSVIHKPETLNALPDVPCLVESVVPIERELACVAARNADGEIALYPVVGMEFHPEANQVEIVHLPSGADATLEQQVLDLSRQILEGLQHVGLLAIEFFATRDGRILINEMAPRPHNSGHLFNEAAECSQFEMHLRAVLNLPLGSTQVEKAAAMVNLVGAEGHSGPVHYVGVEAVLAEPGAYLELYGKTQTRPFRKMGHLILLDESLEAVLAKARRFQHTIQVHSR